MRTRANSTNATDIRKADDTNLFVIDCLYYIWHVSQTDCEAESRGAFVYESEIEGVFIMYSEPFYDIIQKEKKWNSIRRV